MLEDAAGLAAEGQSSRISQERMIELAGRLQATARDIAALAGAAAVIASGGRSHDDWKPEVRVRKNWTINPQEASPVCSQRKPS